MGKKILHIIETAYRATIEEQDDPVVWVTQAMRGGGADITVVLRGNAVCYATKAQDATGLYFGAWKQTQPPRLQDDVKSMVDRGIKVYVVEDDVAERGLEKSDLIGGLATLSRAAIPKLVATFDQISHW